MTLVTSCMAFYYNSSIDLHAGVGNCSLRQCGVCCLSAVVGEAAGLGNREWVVFLLAQTAVYWYPSKCEHCVWAQTQRS